MPRNSHSCLEKWYEFLCFPGRLISSSFFWWHWKISQKETSNVDSIQNGAPKRRNLVKCNGVRSHKLYTPWNWQQTHLKMMLKPSPESPFLPGRAPFSGRVTNPTRALVEAHRLLDRISPLGIIPVVPDFLHHLISVLRLQTPKRQRCVIYTYICMIYVLYIQYIQCCVESSWFFLCHPKEWCAISQVYNGGYTILSSPFSEATYKNPAKSLRLKNQLKDELMDERQSDSLQKKQNKRSGASFLPRVLGIEIHISWSLTNLF